MGRTRIDNLTEAERARFGEWADRWTEIGLCTEPADRDRFEACARECYRYTGIDWPGVVIWVSSPPVLALAAPAASLAIELVKSTRSDRAIAEVVDRAIAGAVAGAVAGKIDRAISEVVAGEVDRAIAEGVDRAIAEGVDRAIVGAVAGAIAGAVAGEIDRAISEAVAGEVDRVVAKVIDEGVAEVILKSWKQILGGQFWVGSWYWGGAWTSFIREVCDLTLPGNLWARARAYEGTMETACWWWPHRHFVMVSERPLAIHRELVPAARPRGRRSYRLHHDSGPAIVWPDGWGVYAWHGVRVPPDVILRPETLDTDRILAEENLEIRRVMLERVGYERILDRGECVHTDEYGSLWWIDISEDEPIALAEVEDTSTGRRYLLRCDPNAYGLSTCRAAVASTWRHPDGSLVFERPEDYVLAVET